MHFWSLYKCHSSDSSCIPSGKKFPPAFGGCPNQLSGSDDGLTFLGATLKCCPGCGELEVLLVATCRNNPFHSTVCPATILLENAFQFRVGIRVRLQWARWSPRGTSVPGSSRPAAEPQGALEPKASPSKTIKKRSHTKLAQSPSPASSMTGMTDCPLRRPAPLAWSYITHAKCKKDQRLRNQGR